MTTPTQFLKPRFECFPTALITLPRWVVFDHLKRPLRVGGSISLGAVNDCDSWATFEEAKAAFESGRGKGVGFVLDGDGLIGFDFDDCVVDGQINPRILDLLQRLNVGYVEFSPSGEGVRAFGYTDKYLFPYWPFKGVRGVIDDCQIEIYCCKRFLSVTGHIIRSEGILPVAGLLQILEKIRGGDQQKTTEDYKSNLQYSSVNLLCSSVDNGEISDFIPADCIPSRYGQRHHCLFRLARFLRGKLPASTAGELRGIVMAWHQKALPNIRTKEFAISWSEFTSAWGKITKPLGQTLAEILKDKDVDTSEFSVKFGYGEVMLTLLQVCLKLQRHFHDEPFFLSVRQAGELLGMHYSDACRLLKVLVSDGVLILVSKGAGMKASRYKINLEAL